MEKIDKKAKDEETTLLDGSVNKKIIDSFRKEYYFLSNTFKCPVTYNGLTYGSSEAAFQAQKDVSRAEEFTSPSLSGKAAKALGNSVELRKDWDSVKVEILEDIVRAKFNQHEDLKEKLLETGDKQLIEGNWWNDTFWGVCRGKGQNNLGKILMKLREEFTQEW